MSRRYLKELLAYLVAVALLGGLVHLTMSLERQSLLRQLSNVGLLVWLIFVAIWTWSILQPVRDWITRNGNGGKRG